MKLPIDMNLSPDWVPVLEEAGWETVHWSRIGKFDAPDHEILKYARSQGYIIFHMILILGLYLPHPRRIVLV
jgi:predicted nuclease of predicted toxin-antitoxin system